MPLRKHQPHASLPTKTSSKFIKKSHKSSAFSQHHPSGSMISRHSDDDDNDDDTSSNVHAQIASPPTPASSHILFSPASTLSSEHPTIALSSQSQLQFENDEDDSPRGCGPPPQLTTYLGWPTALKAPKSQQSPLFAQDVSTSSYLAYSTSSGPSARQGESHPMAFTQSAPCQTNNNRFSSSSSNTTASSSSRASVIVSTPSASDYNHHFFAPTPFHGAPPAFSAEEVIQSVGVITEVGKYILLISLPKFHKHDITLSTRRTRTLHIVADKYDDQGGHFERKVAFGQDANFGAISADFDGATLVITVPRRQPRVNVDGGIVTMDFGPSSLGYELQGSTVMSADVSMDRQWNADGVSKDQKPHHLEDVAMDMGHNDQRSGAPSPPSDSSSGSSPLAARPDQDAMECSDSESESNSSASQPSEASASWTKVGSPIASRRQDVRVDDSSEGARDPSVSPTRDVTRALAQGLYLSSPPSDSGWRKASPSALDRVVEEHTEPPREEEERGRTVVRENSGGLPTAPSAVMVDGLFENPDPRTVVSEPHGHDQVEATPSPVADSSSPIDEDQQEMATPSPEAESGEHTPAFVLAAETSGGEGDHSRAFSTFPSSRRDGRALSPPFLTPATAPASTIGAGMLIRSWSFTKAHRVPTNPSSKTTYTNAQTTHRPTPTSPPPARRPPLQAFRHASVPAPSVRAPPMATSSLNGADASGGNAPVAVAAGGANPSGSGGSAQRAGVSSFWKRWS